MGEEGRHTLPGSHPRIEQDERHIVVSKVEEDRPQVNEYRQVQHQPDQGLRGDKSFQARGMALPCDDGWCFGWCGAISGNRSHQIRFTTAKYVLSGNGGNQAT